MRTCGWQPSFHSVSIASIWVLLSIYVAAGSTAASFLVFVSFRAVYFSAVSFCGWGWVGGRGSRKKVVCWPLASFCPASKERDRMPVCMPVLRGGSVFVKGGVCCICRIVI